MLIHKPVAPIITAKLTSSPSNSNVAINGFRVSNVTRKIRIIRRKFGLSLKETKKRSYAAVADTNCQ